MLTYHTNAAAHLLYTPDTGGAERSVTVTIPDRVAANQKAWDGMTFPTAEGEIVKLCGDDYGLHGAGTGDMVVRPA